jgi:CubicO group peptidase (beta-lactamase class C family)
MSVFPCLLSSLFMTLALMEGTGIARPSEATLRASDIDPIFAPWNKPDSPGMSIAVIRHGRIVYSKGYGSAQLEYAIPITDQTVFHAASVSKQFTAFALLLLEREGKVSLDADVHRYLSWAPRTVKPITLRHLIHHTSGLRDLGELMQLAGWADGDVLTQDQSRYIVSRQKDLNFEPGSRYDYCNTGYFLLAEIVAQVSGMPFSRFAAERIFKPLGMTHTQFRDDPQRLLPNHADSYDLNPSGGYKKALLNNVTVGPTGLQTTSDDLALWLDNFRTARVGGRALINEMQQTGVLNDGSRINYAFGITVDEFQGHEVLWHGGLDAGYRSEVVWFPQEELGIALLSNYGEVVPSVPIAQLARLLLGETATAPPAAAAPTSAAAVPSDINTWEGEYLTSLGVTIRIQADNGAPTLRFHGRSYPLLPAAPRQLVAAPANVQLVFPDQHTQPDEIQFIYIGYPLKAKRVARIETPGAQALRALEGVYYSPELDTTYTVALDSATGNLALQGGRIGALALHFFEPDLFVNESFQQIRFIRDPSGEVSGLRIALGRIPAGVEFKRAAPGKP